jgi:hypothetical protein
MAEDLAKIQVYGVREVIAELRKVAPELRKETIAAMKLAGQPMQQTARALTPASPPISGMARAGGRIPAYSRKAVTGITIRYGGKYSRNSDSWTFLKMQQKDIAGSVFDMAGRRNPGSDLGQALSSRYGDPSRAMWRAAEVHLPAVQRAVLKAVNEAAATINRRIAEV